MQQSAPTPPSPPGRIELPGGINLPLPQQNQPMRPLTDREISAIRDRRSSMSDQLTSAADRRSELANDLTDAPPGTEQGILARIQQLDARILQIEQDIETSGQMLRTGMTIDNGVPLVAQPEPQPLGMSGENIAIIGSMVTVFFLFPLAIGAMRLMFRRAKRIESQPSAEATQRMDRLEQAIDAVAYEIERVGEAQRYQARMLSEANLMPALAPQQHADPVSLRSRDEERVRNAAP